MNLKIKNINDEIIGYAGWTRKQAIHALAKANDYQTNKPMDDGEWWGFRAPTAANSSQAPMCNLPIVVAKLTARIPAGGAFNAPRDVPENAFVIRDEMGAWNKNQMMSDNAVEGSYKHLKVAAAMSAYRVPNYVGFIPIPATNTDSYVGQYIAHHTTAFPGLGREHMSVAISVFTCGLHLFNFQHIHEHYLHVHGLPEGVASLKTLQTITLDKDTAFTCPDLRNIEDVGTEEKGLAVDAVYNMSTAKGIFKSPDNNRSTADLCKSRSQEFLREMKKVCQTKFFGRFKMKLGRTLKASGQNISGDFTVKWQVIENCLYDAVSDVEGVTRLDNYLNLNYSKFTGATLELLMYDVDKEVDSYQGSWDKVKHPGNHRHCLKAKYELVYDIIRNLPDKFSQLKECNKKEISKLYFDADGIKDFPELQKHLQELLETKMIGDLYDKETITVGRRIPTNSAKVQEGTWTSEQSKSYKNAVRGKAPSRAEDIENQKNLIEFILKLGEDKKDNSLVTSSKEYINYIKDKNIKCCTSCFSQGCKVRYQAAKSLGIPYNPKKCRREEQKTWKFGQLEGLKVPEPEQQNPKIKVKTVSIQPKQSLPTTNSLVDDLYAFDAETNEDFMVIPSKMARITTRPRFTKATIPDTDEMLLDMITVNKECNICGLDDLNSLDLFEHWEEDHGLETDASVEEWNAALEEYEENDMEPEVTDQEDPPIASADNTPASQVVSTASTPYAVSTASVSHAVSTAFQENMGPLRQDLENQLNILKREMIGQVQSEIKLEVTKNITELANTSSDCSDKMSEILANSSESRMTLSRLTSESSEAKMTLSRLTSAQTSNNVQCDRIDSTLKKIKQNIEASQDKGEHIVPNQAGGKIIQSKVEHTDPNWAEKTEKISHFEANQNQILELLSSLKKDNDSMQKRLDKIENNVTPKFDDTKCGGTVTPKFHITAASIDPGAINTAEPDAVKLAGLDDIKTKVTHLTPVLNSPVKERFPQTKPQNSCMSPMSPTNAEPVPATMSNPEKRRRRMKSRRPTPPTRTHPAPGAQWTSFIKSLFSSIEVRSPNAIWGLLMVLVAALALPLSQANPIHSPSSILSSLQPSPYRTVYPLLEMETRTWAYQIKEVEEAAYSIVDDACAYVAVADKQCKTHPTSCRTTMLNLKNFEKAISKALDVVLLLQRLCDVGELPSSKQAMELCRSGEDWRLDEFATKNYKFQADTLGTFSPKFGRVEETLDRARRGTDTVISRHPRLAISVPILIGLAVGAGVLGTAGITAKIVAEEESTRVVDEVRAGRRVDIANSLKNNFVNHNYTKLLAVELDVIRMTEAISTHATVLLHDAEDLKQDLAELASRKEKLKYSSSFAEEYWTAIREVNLENDVGLTRSEVNRKTRISAELSTLVTTLSPLSNSSSSCKNQILTKTLLIPVIDHRRKTEIKIVNGRMVPRSLPLLHKTSKYFVIPKDSVMSRETDMFGQSSHVIGRICTASMEVNVTSIPSSEVISESFKLEFIGTIELNETCSGNKSSVPVIHTIHSPAIVTVPVLCSVSSKEFSCGAVVIRSGDTKLVHTTHHRTTVTMDNLVEDEVSINNNTFFRSTMDIMAGASLGSSSWLKSITGSSYRTPLIIIGVIISAVLMAAAIPAGMMLKRTGGSKGVNINNYNSNQVSADNANKVDGDIGGVEAAPLYPTLHGPAAVEHEDEEEEEEEDIDLQIWKILRIPAHQRTPKERIAADNWQKQQDVFQLQP